MIDFVKSYTLNPFNGWKKWLFTIVTLGYALFLPIIFYVGKLYFHIAFFLINLCTLGILALLLKRDMLGRRKEIGSNTRAVNYPNYSSEPNYSSRATSVSERTKNQYEPVTRKPTQVDAKVIESEVKAKLKAQVELDKKKAQELAEQQQEEAQYQYAKEMVDVCRATAHKYGHLTSCAKSKRNGPNWKNDSTKSEVARLEKKAAGQLAEHKVAYVQYKQAIKGLRTYPSYHSNL